MNFTKTLDKLNFLGDKFDFIPTLSKQNSQICIFYFFCIVVTDYRLTDAKVEPFFFGGKDTE